MELRIVPYQIPEKIEFNYEEIIQESNPLLMKKLAFIIQMKIFLLQRKIGLNLTPLKKQ